MLINFFSKKNTFLKQRNKGQAMIVSVIYFLFISLSVVFGVMSPSVREYKIASTDLNSKKVYYGAESGVEDAVYRAKNSMIQFDSNNQKTINLISDGVETTTLLTINPITQGITIDSTGQVAKGLLNYERRISSALEVGEGVDFNYGVHVGTGGIRLDNGQIYGNVFSNGPIIGNDQNDLITGSAISSNREDLIDFNNTEKEFEINFGTKEIPSIAQSFIASKDYTLGKISFCLNKNFEGDGNQITILIYDDQDGYFSGDPKRISGVEEITKSENCTWVDAKIEGSDSIISFIKDKKYWIVLETTSVESTEKFFSIAQNKGIYTENDSKVYDGYSWNSDSDIDYFFEIYEVTFGRIEGIGRNPLKIGENSQDVVKSHYLNNIYTQGSKFCNSPDPTNEDCEELEKLDSINYLLDDDLISGWKQQATDAAKSLEPINFYNGDLNLSSGNYFFGPGIITGDLNFNGNSRFYFNSPVLIKGRIFMKAASSEIKVNGNNSGVILVEEEQSLLKNATIGDVDNYVMIAALPRYENGQCTSTSASLLSIEVQGASGGSSILYSPCLAISINSSKANVKEVVAFYLSLTGGADIEYNTGLTNVNFSSGPSGGYNISSWEEE